MNKNTQNLLKLQIFLKYLYMCVYICSIYIYIYIYICSHSCGLLFTIIYESTQFSIQIDQFKVKCICVL